MATKSAKTRGATGDGPCNDWLEPVLAWLDGELTPAAARRVSRHVAACPRCGGLAEDLRRAIAACRMAGDCRVPTSIHRRARSRAQRIISGR